MKEIPKGKRKVWKDIFDIFGETLDFANETQYNQFIFQMMDFENEKVRSIRMIQVADIANTIIDLDAMEEGTERVFTTGEVVKVSALKELPLLLKSGQEPPLLIRFYGITGLPNLPYNPSWPDDEFPIGIFSFDHLIDESKPVRLKDVINRVFRVASWGEVFSLEGGIHAKEESFKFDLTKRVKLLYLPKNKVSIFMAFIGKEGIALIIRKELSL